MCYSISHVFGSTTIVFVEQDQPKTYSMTFPSSDLFNQELLQPLNLLNFEFVNRTSEHIDLLSSLFLENQLIYSSSMSSLIICSPNRLIKLWELTKGEYTWNIDLVLYSKDYLRYLKYSTGSTFVVIFFIVFFGGEQGCVNNDSLFLFLSELHP